MFFGTHQVVDISLDRYRYMLLICRYMRVHMLLLISREGELISSTWADIRLTGSDVHQLGLQKCHIAAA